jgi:predicted RNA-binding Zn-ribbon protein involved in translation (DUF1610 family)
MINNETKEPRELRFVCPECGSNELIAAVAGWLEIDDVYDNGVFTWSDIRIKQFEDVHCSDCGYDLGQDEEEGWIEWLISHCNQDESEAGQAQEDNSSVPSTDAS